MSDLVAQVRARIADTGYELVDLQRRGSGRRVRLQVRIDLPDSEVGHGVTVDDCARVSRALESWLDDTQELGPDYVLEVSSPGIERPIRWPEHWERFVGHDVNVTVRDLGRIRATIVAVSEDRDSVTLRPKGRPDSVQVPLAEAKSAKLAYDWDK